jgi:hypothetical protein
MKCMKCRACASAIHREISIRIYLERLSESECPGDGHGRDDYFMPWVHARTAAWGFLAMALGFCGVSCLHDTMIGALVAQRLLGGRS